MRLETIISVCVGLESCGDDEVVKDAETDGGWPYPLITGHIRIYNLRRRSARVNDESFPGEVA